jgi:hypothetical protein
MGMLCLRAQVTTWCRWAIVSCSARVSERLEKSLPSGWMKSLYRSIRTIAVGPSVAVVPGEVNVDMAAGECGWEEENRRVGGLDGKNEMGYGRPVGSMVLK